MLPYYIEWTVCQSIKLYLTWGSASNRKAYKMHKMLPTVASSPPVLIVNFHLGNAAHPLHADPNNLELICLLSPASWPLTTVVPSLFLANLVKTISHDSRFTSGAVFVSYNGGGMASKSAEPLMSTWLSDFVREYARLQNLSWQVILHVNVKTISVLQCWPFTPVVPSLLPPSLVRTIHGDWHLRRLSLFRWADVKLNL